MERDLFSIFTTTMNLFESNYNVTYCKIQVTHALTRCLIIELLEWASSTIDQTQSYNYEYISIAIIINYNTTTADFHHTTTRVQCISIATSVCSKTNASR